MAKYPSLADAADDARTGGRSDEDRGLSASCFFGSNQHNKSIEQQLEEPGRDEKVMVSYTIVLHGTYTTSSSSSVYLSR